MAAGKISWDSLAQGVMSRLNPLEENPFTSALVEFIGFNNSNDWRVKLSIPPNFMSASAIFEPLAEAGGFVFPYTPEITLSGQAEYEEVNTTHQNFPFMAYKHSKPGEITITGEFYVQDDEQAKYWIACLHFLRSVTKMFQGGTSEEGSPPPILYLHGYGDYVLNRIPVVVKSFNLSLPKDCDYISTSVSSGINLRGSPFLLFSQPTIEEMAADAVGWVGNSLFKKDSHVPTKSSFTVTLQPVYSKLSAKNFSLMAFSLGSYVRGGYI